MKKIVFWPRAVDWKILSGVGCLAVAGLVGAVLPGPSPFDDNSFLMGCVAAFLLVSVWSCFRLVRPTLYSRKWVSAEFIAVPVVWILLVAALGLWFWHLRVSVEDLLPHRLNDANDFQPIVLHWPHAAQA